MNGGRAPTRRFEGVSHLWSNIWYRCHREASRPRPIERTGQKPPSIGSLYAAIDRLEDRGLIKTRLGDLTAERGGRAKLCVTVTTKGQATLGQSLQALASLGAALKGNTVGANGVLV